MARHVKAAEEFGTTTAYHVTKDGIHPGSSIDFYERETRWVERYQTAEKEQKKDRSRARNDRTQASMSRIVVAYDEQNRRAEAKVQRRQGSFRRQKQRCAGPPTRSVCNLLNSTLHTAERTFKLQVQPPDAGNGPVEQRPDPRFPRAGHQLGHMSRGRRG